MIRVFDATETKFNNHNGIKILHPLFAEITKVDNGDYYIEIEDSIDNREYYQNGLIIGADTPWGIQCFRCYNPIIENNRVSCKAWHLFYDSKNYVIARKISRSGTCDAVIKDYKNDVHNAINCPFSDSKIATISSDITKEADTEIEAVSLYDAFVYLTNIYGGHWVRNQFNFSINTKTGQDRGVVLAHNKNITDIKIEENWDNVCTAVMPYTMVGDTKITAFAPPSDTDYFIELNRDEKVDYNVQFTKVVEFKNEFAFGSNPTREDYDEVRAWLCRVAANYLRDNRFPQVNYSVSANIDNVSDVGDIIRVKHPKCNVDIETEVISVKYDAIREKYTNIEFGNFRKEIKNIFTETASNAIIKTSEAIKGVVNDSTTSLIDLLTSGNVTHNGLTLYTDDTHSLQIGSALDSSTNKLRIRQKDGDTWGEWRNLQEESSATGASKEVVLFDGIGSYNKVTLKQSINNTDYSAIEIFYGIFTTGYDGNTFDHYQSVKVSVPVGKKVSLISSAIDANDGVTIGVGIVEIASDVITFKKNNAYKGSNMTTTSNKNLVYIRKVIGYKV